MTNRLIDLLQQDPIVVTGMGCYCAAGDSVDALWQAAVAGQSPAHWQSFDFGGKAQSLAVCSAPPWDAATIRLPPAVRKADRYAQLAYLAAQQAWDHARLADAYPPARVGVAVGSSRGPVGKLSASVLALPHRRMPPTWTVDSTFGAVSGALAQCFPMLGPGVTVSAACASAAFAIAHAAEQIVLGRADAMLAGGAEAPLLPVLVAQMHAAGVLGSHPQPGLACRPFDATRNGLVLGEGGALLVLESQSSAAARGAPVLARLAGWATGMADAGRARAREDGADLLRSMHLALQTAGISPDHLDYLNAHGTGTVINDLAEAHATAALLGSRSYQVPCTSTKPVTGHCLGATPAIEAIIAIQALRHQIIPPTANCHQPDPACAINVQPLTARPAKINCVMSNSLGFWGYHASLVFTQS